MNYPTEADLDKIRNWPPDSYDELMRFVRLRWAYANAGFWKYVDESGHRLLHISTAGWSGNEQIIAALQDNATFWLMCWFSSRRGGHYMFDLSRWEHAKEMSDMGRKLREVGKGN